MDQNQEPPKVSDTPQPQSPMPPSPVEQPVTPTSPTPDPVVPTSTPAAPVSPQPTTPTIPDGPTIPAPSTETPVTASNDSHSSASSLPPSSHKKTIAVAAAGISVLLVILGVYAMSKDNFNTQTKQEAAVPSQAPTSSVPTLTPTPSDIVDQDLSGVEAALKNADAEAAVADQGLSATPADLQ